MDYTREGKDLNLEQAQTHLTSRLNKVTLNFLYVYVSLQSYKVTNKFYSQEYINARVQDL